MSSFQVDDCHLDQVLECVSPIHKSQTMENYDGGQWATPNLITRMCQAQTRSGTYQHSPGSLSSSEGWWLLYLCDIRVHWSPHILWRTHTHVILLNKICLPWQQITEKVALKCLFASTQCKTPFKNFLCCKNCANCYIQYSEVSCILLSIFKQLN